MVSHCYFVQPTNVANPNQPKQKNQQTVQRKVGLSLSRWQNHLNPELQNAKIWSPLEHQRLFELYLENSHKWCELSTLLEGEGYPKRSDNNIKNYFYSVLKRTIKVINEIIREKNREIKRRKS